jgi:hypothetical protein
MIPILTWNLDEDEDEDAEEDDLKDDDDDFEEIASFLNTPGGLDDDPDLSTTKLREINVRIPVYIDKSVYGNNLIHFVIESEFPNGTKRSTERLYSDFVRLRKYFSKTFPQCKVQLQPSYLPKKKSNDFATFLALDQRRHFLQSYLRGLMTDDAIGKLAHRIVLEFIKQKGMLFGGSSKSSLKRRLLPFNSPFSTSINSLSQTSPSEVNKNIKMGIVTKAIYRTCLKDIRISLDKNLGVLNMYCKINAKEPHCVIYMEDIEEINLLNMEPSSNSEHLIPVNGEQYIFMDIKTTISDIVYFCSNKSNILEWYNLIKSCKTIPLTMSPKSSIEKRSSAPMPMSQKVSLINRSKYKFFDALNHGDSKIVLNHKKLLFRRTITNIHPCDVVFELLNQILTLFQEYTDSKCIMTSKIQQQITKFSEAACDLQCLDMEKIGTHSQRLAFYLNLYHTLVIHSHLELGIGPAPCSSKKLKIIFKTVCYDVNNQLFSILDIEHSILRSKMSRPVILNNTMFSYLISPQFGKKDPRNRWCLTKPDLRINFILNSGSKSSIYNVWPFSHEPELLNKQLDHASTHFLSEQVHIDHDRNVVYLPRICQYYGNDLGGRKSRIIKTLLHYMSGHTEREGKSLIFTRSKMDN